MSNDIRLEDAERQVAPDGSAVYVLGAVQGAGTAVFELPPHVTARAVRHPRVEEVWFVLAGTGRLWRRTAGGHDLGEAELLPNRSFVLPRGTSFQFRNIGGEPLRILGVTAPPWAGEGDAEVLESGHWPETV